MEEPLICIYRILKMSFYCSGASVNPFFLSEVSRVSKMVVQAALSWDLAVMFMVQRFKFEVSQQRLTASIERNARQVVGMQYAMRLQDYKFPNYFCAYNQGPRAAASKAI